MGLALGRVHGPNFMGLALASNLVLSWGDWGALGRPLAADHHAFFCRWIQRGLQGKGHWVSPCP